MTLFPLQPEPASTNEELGELSKKYPQMDAIYLNVHMRPDWKKVRDFFDNEWPNFCKLADDNFASEFQINFNRRAWEIYLFYILRTNGFKIIEQSKTKPNPDFKIEVDEEKSLFIEAVTAGKGEEENKVETISDQLSRVPPGTILSGVSSIDESNHPKVRRILNALDAKVKQYHNKRKSIVSKKDRYIIAVNGADIDGSMMAIDLILEAVAGINPAIHIPIKSDGTAGSAYKTLRKTIPNATGTSLIDLVIFDQENFNEIGAIIYSGNSVVDIVLNELHDEIVVIYNPNVISDKGIADDIFASFKQIEKIPTGWKYINFKE